MSDEQEAAPGNDGLIKRLFRRHVIQTAAIYVAVAWGAVEILLTMTERLGWPDWINTDAIQADFDSDREQILKLCDDLPPCITNMRPSLK